MKNNKRREKGVSLDVNVCAFVSVCCVGKGEWPFFYDIYATRDEGTSHMSPSSQKGISLPVPEKGKKINDGGWAWLKTLATSPKIQREGKHA